MWRFNGGGLLEIGAFIFEVGSYIYEAATGSSDPVEVTVTGGVVSAKELWPEQYTNNTKDDDNDYLGAGMFGGLGDYWPWILILILLSAAALIKWK